MMKVTTKEVESLIHHPMSHVHSVVLNRKRWALSQGELADLLGVSQAHVSRIEEGESAKTTKLETVLALQIIFDRSPRSLFPGIYDAVEELVIRRGVKLDTSLRQKHDPDSMKKKQLLTIMVKRAASPSSTP